MFVPNSAVSSTGGFVPGMMGMGMGRRLPPMTPSPMKAVKAPPVKPANASTARDLAAQAQQENVQAKVAEAYSEYLSKRADTGMGAAPSPAMAPVPAPQPAAAPPGVTPAGAPPAGAPPVDPNTGAPVDPSTAATPAGLGGPPQPPPPAPIDPTAVATMSQLFDDADQQDNYDDMRYGNIVQAGDRFGLNKSAGNPFAGISNWASKYAPEAGNWMKQHPQLTGAGIGAGVGAIGGALMDDKHRGRGALLGGLSGAGLGGMAGMEYGRHYGAQPTPDTENPASGETYYRNKFPAVYNWLHKQIPGYDHAQPGVIQSPDTDIPSNPSMETVACDLARFAKSAWQDNSSQSRTSATGESENIGFASRNDDYDRGPAAWHNSAKYLKHGGSHDSRVPKPSKLAADLANEARRQGMYGGGAQTAAPVTKPVAPPKLDTQPGQMSMKQGNSGCTGLASRIRLLKAHKTIQKYLPSQDNVASGDSENDTRT